MLLFRGDVWHQGVGYLNDHYRIHGHLYANNYNMQRQPSVYRAGTPPALEPGNAVYLTTAETSTIGNGIYEELSREGEGASEAGA